MNLLKDRRYWPIFWTQFCGAFNDNFLKNALLVLVTFKSAEFMGIPHSMMGAVAGGVFILPFFLFSATSGQLADKYEKSILIRWIKIAEIVIMAVAAAGFLLHQTGILLASLFLMGLHSTFFGPLKYSILPQLLAADELIAANAFIEMGTFLAILLGTILGGVLVAIEPSGPVVVSVGLVLVAWLGWWFSLRIERAPAEDPGLVVQWNPVPPTRQILAFTKEVRSVFLAILGISWFWFFGATFLALFPGYTRDFLFANETVGTLFLAIFSIGIGAGSVLCEKLSGRRLELGLVPLGTIGMTAFSLDLFLIGQPWPRPEGAALGVAQFLARSAGLRITADLFMLAVFSGFFIVPLYTLIQQRTAEGHRSRVIAGNNIWNALFMVVSSLLILGLLAQGWTIPQVFLLSSLLNACVAFYIYALIPEFFLRFIAWILAHGMYRVRSRGFESIPESGPALLVCNHVSFVDWLIISAVVKRPIRFVMDHAFVKLPLSGLLFRSAKVIPIAPAMENPDILKAAFEKIAEELDQGELVCIFPEGKITHDGKLNPFRPGLQRALERNPVPVIPMALRGLWGSFFSRHGGRAMNPKNFARRWRSHVELICGEPVAPQQATAAMLQQRVAGLLGEKPSQPIEQPATPC